MKKAALCFLSLWVLLPAAALDFQETRSAHFQVLSNRNSADAALLMYQLELLYVEAAQILPAKEIKFPSPRQGRIRVYDIEDPEEYRFWLQEEWNTHSDSYILLRPGLLRSPCMAITGNWTQEDRTAQLRYLMMTLYMLQQGDYDPWLLTGLSAYFESPLEDMPLEGFWLDWLNSRDEGYRWKEPLTLMNMEREPLSADPDLKGECWLLVYFLLETNRSEESRVLWDSLSGSFNKDVPLPVSFSDNYALFRKSLIHRQLDSSQLDRLYRDDKYSEVLKMAELLEKTRPAEAYYYQGLVQYKSGEWDKSLESFKLALQWGAPEAETRTSLAMLYWQQDERDLCKEELMIVKGLNPGLIPETLRHLVD